ncbi:hypothetical protein TRM7557_01523 [Tritonibacter multivorans]|uniref:DUF3306 domain-containing protein n=1 Tax=Tritonibacter multivorans TaxID=928856 RepID=A0A0P1GQ41_9RHOB|nr:DUF3306 domain-containing protein [Tritonibacter multivorans]MDA7422328.1 DUF3306 domain-containing protein [Tritonibacter multivorans]CUH77723.1 hypothetical protein TRM7557_01523 [Tritonibacter multivorans]SFD13312.1 Protein of unknown function [Tritonibacter multivorans]
MSDFWSRRRAAVEAEAETDAQLEAAATVAAREAEQADKTDEELLAELDLPDPESLGAGDDFTVFLKDAVPPRLKTRALRRLWGTNPLLANIDGLVDYGEDFTDAALAVENIQTAYQVGKGMTAHVEELARQAELEAQEAENPEPDDQPNEEIETPEETPDETPVVALTEAPAPQEDLTLQAEPEADFAPPRRMRFAFDADVEVEAI